MEAPILAGVVLLGVSGAALLGAAALTQGHPTIGGLARSGLAGFLRARPPVRQPQCVSDAPARDLAGLSSTIICVDL